MSLHNSQWGRCSIHSDPTAWHCYSNDWHTLHYTLSLYKIVCSLIRWSLCWDLDTPLMRMENYHWNWRPIDTSYSAHFPSNAIHTRDFQWTSRRTVSAPAMFRISDTHHRRTEHISLCRYPRNRWTRSEGTIFDRLIAFSSASPSIGSSIDKTRNIQFIHGNGNVWYSRSNKTTHHLV